MILVSIKTDTVIAKIALWNDERLINSEQWQAHRQLADTIHVKLKNLLGSDNIGWNDIEGIVVYQGPGSFTGLRIGIAVANALAYNINIPIVSESAESWEISGINRLLIGDDQKICLPEYGGEANVTLPKK